MASRDLFCGAHCSAVCFSSHPRIGAWVSKMLLQSHPWLLSGWAGVPPCPALHLHRHPPLQLNFLDDWKAGVDTQQHVHGGTLLTADVDDNVFLRTLNAEHMEELRQVARVKATADGVDWRLETLQNVEAKAVSDMGMLLQILLCSAKDQRCILVDISIPWPMNMPSRRLPEMRSAFTELSRRAYAAVLDDADAMPPEYQKQQQECSGLMSLMNSKFGKLLRFYALKHAREALSPTEQVEKAKLTQLTFEGLTLELVTLDVGAYSLEVGGTRTLTRQPLPVSILFPNRCQSADDVEAMLVRMFDNTAAAVEEGRISVDGVAAEPAAEMLAAERSASELEDDRTASFRSRDKRLRRAVRERRMADYNRATARYIELSRKWSSSSSAGD